MRGRKRESPNIVDNGGAVTANHHPDVNIAVQNFLRNFESLFRLPLITDAETDRVFGEEMSAALLELERYNQQEELCHGCQSRCCLLVDCELYVPEFSRCPIHSRRPLLCRMHFCNKFTPVYQELVQAAGDVFLESLLAAEKVDPQKTKLLDSPPLGKLIPDLIPCVRPYLTAFKEGRRDEPAALKAIASEIEKYYLSC